MMDELLPDPVHTPLALDMGVQFSLGFPWALLLSRVNQPIT